MFDQTGIGIHDLAWIHRDQFVHYVQFAYARNDAGDWPRLRGDLLQALTAAFGLDAPSVNGHQLTPRQRCVLELLDDIRREHDPATNWPAFFDTLWSRRHAMRPDLP